MLETTSHLIIIIQENRVGYLVNYLGHFLRLIDSLKALGSIRPMEALGCSNIGTDDQYMLKFD